MCARLMWCFLICLFKLEISEENNWFISYNQQEKCYWEVKCFKLYGNIIKQLLFFLTLSQKSPHQSHLLYIHQTFQLHSCLAAWFISYLAHNLSDSKENIVYLVENCLKFMQVKVLQLHIQRACSCASFTGSGCKMKFRRMQKMQMQKKKKSAVRPHVHIMSDPQGGKVVVPLQVQLRGEDRWIRVNVSCPLIKRRSGEKGSVPTRE